MYVNRLPRHKDMAGRSSTHYIKCVKCEQSGKQAAVRRYASGLSVRREANNPSPQSSP